MALLGRWARLSVEAGRGIGVHVRGHSRRSSAPLALRIVEQWRLLWARGVTAENYYLYALDRLELGRERKREFIGDYDRWRWMNRLNPPFYRLLTEDKIVFKRYMAHAGVAVPRLVAVIGPYGRSEEGHSLRSREEVRRWLGQGPVEHVFFKPALGTRGHGVLSLGRRCADGREWERLPAGRIDVDGILDHLDTQGHGPYFMVEERLGPHPALEAFSPDVLHTARILTALVAERVEVIAAALRIGEGRSPADNVSRGNLVAPIDVETGAVGARAARKGAQGLERVATHPVSGAAIGGRTMPDWDTALALVRRAAQAMPMNLVLGWDVGFSARGPVVIEANDLWDPDVTQLAHDRGLLVGTLRAVLEAHGLRGSFACARW